MLRHTDGKGRARRIVRDEETHSAPADTNVSTIPSCNTLIAAYKRLSQRLAHWDYPIKSPPRRFGEGTSDS
jgi:hypothetical protein